MAVVFSEGWVHAGGASSRSSRCRPRRPRLRACAILVLDSRPKRGQAESAAAMAAVAAAAKRRSGSPTPTSPPAGQAVRGPGRGGGAAGWTSASCCPASPTCRSPAAPATATSRALLERGVRIFEYQPAILHAKTLVADGLVSIVGSTNLDFRSFLFNAECDLLILDAPTAPADGEGLPDRHEERRGDPPSRTGAAAPGSRGSATAWRAGSRRCFKSRGRLAAPPPAPPPPPRAPN